MFSVIEGKSDRYGVDPPLAYLKSKLPYLLTFLYPLALYAFADDLKQHLFIKKQFPIMSSMIVTLVFMVSLIRHKEARFCIIIMPLVFIQMGDLIARYSKNRPGWVLKAVVLLILLQGIALGVLKSLDYKGNYTDVLRYL